MSDLSAYRACDYVANAISRRHNNSDPLAPPPTNVTSTTFQNIYAYAPEQLWLAYGLAILFACFTTVIGLFAVCSNHASYSADFSTVLRTTREARISEELRPADLRGQDPLPPHLRNAYITLGQAAASNGPIVKYSQLRQGEQTDSRHQ